MARKIILNRHYSAQRHKTPTAEKRMLALFATIAVWCAAWCHAENRVEMIDIAPVWAGHKVGFALLTQPSHQYVAYYDNQRRMTVAMRALDKTEWSFQVLPETVGWDSHNYIAMAIDSTGSLHLSGNMHVTPLKYFQNSECARYRQLHAR